MATIPDSTASSLASSILSSLGTLSGTTSNVGSNLNISALVTQLVAADRAAPQAQITSQTNSTNAEVSALGSLMGALGTFQSALQKVADPTAFNANKVTSSNSSVVTATVDRTAGTGSYGVQVLALAQAHQLASTAFSAGSNATVGTGTLTIAQGSSSFKVTIDSTNNTLSGIAAAINSAPGNTGVQATILTEQGGAHLVLTASQTGAASAITVTTADAGLAQLNYNATTKNLTQLQAAQDSHIQIAMFDHYSATNSVSDAVTGVTFNLQSAVPGTTATVSVTPDTSGTASLVSSFVSAYNQLHSVISGLDSYDPTTKTAGAMLGSATLANIESQLRVDLSNTVSTAAGKYNSLASIGVTKQADGTLTLDTTKLNGAMAQSPDAVAQIFSSGNGIATRLNKDIVTQLQSGGPLSSRNQQLQRTLTDIKGQTTSLDQRMAAVQSTYTAQFTALETLLAKMQTTSSYLTQQFNALLKTSGN
jgi:flagellar hook-associated protein 2